MESSKGFFRGSQLQVANGVLSVALVEKVEGEASMFQVRLPLLTWPGMEQKKWTPISRVVYT